MSSRYQISTVSRLCKSTLRIDSCLLVVTSTSVIALLDIRTMEITQRFQHPLEFGTISAVTRSQHWLVLGTTTGILSLRDLRFGLLLKSWKAGGGVTSCQIHPSKGRGRWVIVSLLRTNSEDSPWTEVYDVETGKLMEVYEVRLTRPTVKTAAPPSEPADVIPSKHALIAQLATARPPADPVTTPSILTVMVGQGFASLPGHEEEIGLSTSVPETRSMTLPNPGWMITAGEDRVVRYWDLAKPSEGFVICGSSKEKDVVFKFAILPSKSSFVADCRPCRQGAPSIPSLYYTLPNSHRAMMGEARHVGVAAQRQPLRPHYDAICALGSVETPFSSCIVSGDRSGVVKVWRMESGSGGSRGERS